MILWELAVQRGGAVGPTITSTEFTWRSVLRGGVGKRGKQGKRGKRGRRAGVRQGPPALRCGGLLGRGGHGGAAGRAPEERTWAGLEARGHRSWGGAEGASCRGRRGGEEAPAQVLFGFVRNFRLRPEERAGRPPRPDLVPSSEGPPRLRDRRPGCREAVGSRGWSPGHSIRAALPGDRAPRRPLRGAETD